MPNPAPSPSQPSETDIPALPPGVRVVTLDHGLVLILREDHSAPVVSAQAWCKSGSIHEDRWLGAGLSHVLEHMLFKGTATRPSGQIDREVQDAGGYMNAYTSFDRTVYYINVPNTGGRIALDILCDIMQNASIPADELEKEKQVILREMDMSQDDPGQKSSRRLFETAYTRSNYRHTIIGYPDIFNRVTREDLISYYRERYAPNNIFFVVVGDFDAAQVQEQIRLAFATAKAQPAPPIYLPDEPVQLVQRDLVEEGPVELGHFHLSWHIPDLRHSDVPTLDVLATLLGAGRSARLYQEVRERLGLVNSVDAWTYNPGNPGLFGMSAIVNADKFDAARQAMLAEIERMKREPVSEAELGKAVKQFVAATLATRKTMQGQAQDLGGSWLAAGDLNFSARYLAAVKRIRPADLQRVASLYLTDANRTQYALLPEGTRAAVVESADVFTPHPITKFTLPNGLSLLVKEDHRLPFVEFRAVFRGGVLSETPATNGVTLLTAKMLLQGTATRSAEQLASEIESLGGSVDSYGGNNSLGVNLEVMSNDFAAGLGILADVILNPVFPAPAFERERDVQLASIRAQKDHLLQRAGRLMRQGLFNDNGYGLDVNGTETSVTGLSAASLAPVHATLCIPNNCVLAVFGDVDTAAVVAAVEQAFGAWKPGLPVRETESPAPLREVRRVGEEADKKQAVLVIGFPGVTLYNPDRYALELIQEACSDLGSRLFTRIRENLGLAYYVGAQHFPGLIPGYIAFYAGTEPEKARQVEEEMLKEARTLCESGLTAEELQRAKAKIIGQKKIARQDLGSWAATAALDELYGLGFDHSDGDDARFESLTLEQVAAAARKHLDAAAMVVSVVQPPAAPAAC